MSRTNVRATAPPPRPVRPELTREKGVVVGASVPALAPVVEQGSLADVPFVNAYEAPDAVAISRRNPDGTWRDITCAEFAAEVLTVAKGLIAHGLRPGDRLAIMSRTRYEWTLLDFAAWAAGLITVPVYPTSSPHQVGWILRDAGVRACAVEGVQEARTLSALRPDLPELEHLWQLTAMSGSESSAIGQISAAGHEIPDAAVTERRALLAPWRAATMIYTSGTTGEPKGCVITHGNLFAEVDNAIELLYPVFRSLTDEPASSLLFLPLAHVLGRVVALGCVRARVRLGHAPSIQTDDLLGDLAGFRPTFLFAIPYLLEKVFNTGRATAEKMGRAGSFDRAARVARKYGAAAEARQHGTATGPGLGLRAARTLYDPLVYRRIRAALGGKLQHIVCGGSPLGRRLGTFFEGAGVSIYEGYGLTETTAAATVTAPNAPRIGTVGWPLPGTEVRIAADGEILLRGPTVFGGYWDSGRGEVTPATDPDGWLATGDLGSLDEDGYLTITGRKKDLIITSGGKNVAPGPLEDALRAHPLISQCLVVGDNRPYLAALLTLDPDGLAHWQQVTDRRHVPVAELIADPELLRHLQRALDEANSLVSTAESIRAFRVLPRDFTEDAGHLTPSMKLRRAAVLRDLAAVVDELYEQE
ncbi:AMP-dependent synthetase/ligase [Streptomyces litchfieldiae]|uniref:Acyl-CoA synthetase n=1 Tax=Streptomyces litchfieldiae TaxID=3075543 RepID=A0ABU2MZH8_9ACTN|nr:AMP-dependent synthetase/ligase [Streptomyces sp. DSM 44938]MDT0346678.1 AMP-dependent synthetase/ligase [Streptomyces sp. DSM 44938]